MVKIRRIYGQKVGAFESEELGGREESRGTGEEASSRHPGIIVLSQPFLFIFRKLTSRLQKVQQIRCKIQTEESLPGDILVWTEPL